MRDDHLGVGAFPAADAVATAGLAHVERLGSGPWRVVFDRLLAVARKSAKDRLCHLLLEIRSRLVLTKHLEEDRRFELPLSQSVIGDAVGLTNVSVSRCFSELEAEGAIERQGRVFEFDVEALAERVDFEDRFSTMQTTWFAERHAARSA